MTERKTLEAFAKLAFVEKFDDFGTGSLIEKSDILEGVGDFSKSEPVSERANFPRNRSSARASLRIPFSYENRQPYITDRFIYIPWDIDLSGYQFPEISTLFGNDQPLFIEYCSGNGSWILEQAIANPNKNFFAIEKRLDRVRKIWYKTQKLNLTNIIPIYTEGLIFTKTCLKEASTETVYINFPDPWPKRRHRKNRIMNGPFIEELFRILKHQGRLIFVTDDKDYSESFIADMGKKALFTTPTPAPYYTMPPEGYGMSYFREIFEKQGKNTRYHLYEKG